jgi:hypothetical protein
LQGQRVGRIEDRKPVDDLRVFIASFQATLPPQS